MFSTFRQRILFWFLLLISSNIIIITLTSRYLSSRSRIEESSKRIEVAYVLFLKIAGTQKDFFAYDTKNPDFFRTRTSHNLRVFDSLRFELLAVMGDAQNFERQGQFPPARLVNILDSLFKTEVDLVLRRGYKDFSLEGAMRHHAHWLENGAHLQPETILSLRRNEKDYIIRNERRYVDNVNELCRRLTAAVKGSFYPNKDSILLHLAAYQSDFNSIVRLDSVSGLKDDSGLKLALDKKALQVEKTFEGLVASTRQHQQALFQELTILYGSIVLILFIVSVIVSFYIARSVTKPLTELTEYITRFVDSNFTTEDRSPAIRSKDEIGRLTQNFSILKEEVISHLRFFKQKVEERTLELAESNEKLLRVNQANSRFVPKEFLDFLNKAGIEDVKLGDQTERDMTIMFTDIRSFTRISETLTPQENFDFLNSYLKEIVPAIRRHGGFIDKFIGDSVMALFPGKPDDAIVAAIEIAETVKRFSASRGGDPLLTGTGVHFGRLILGTIGHDDRLETTVISDTVNIASRVEGLTRHYDCEILVTKSCLGEITDRSKFATRFIDTVRMKGKTREVEVFEVLLEKDASSFEYYEQFASALTLYRARKLAEACSIFRELHNRNANDGVVKLYLRRCEDYMKNGLPRDWDGIQVMYAK